MKLAFLLVNLLISMTFFHGIVGEFKAAKPAKPVINNYPAKSRGISSDT